MRLDQKVSIIIQILDFSYTTSICMGFTCTEIMTEISK